MSTTQSGEDLAKRLNRTERDWQSMQRICHDFFHGWRRVVADHYGEEKARQLEVEFYGRIGNGTGAMYLQRGGNPDDLEKVVFTLVRASEVMGETAHLERDGNDVLLVHTACPWQDSFRANGVPDQCQAGCDNWFRTTAASISPLIKVVTESALPAGDRSCTRRFSRVP